MDVWTFLKHVPASTNIWIEKKDGTHIEHNEAAYISAKAKNRKIVTVYPSRVQAIGELALVIVVR